jgi:hypothetical protein
VRLGDCRFVERLLIVFRAACHAHRRDVHDHVRGARTDLIGVVVAESVGQLRACLGVAGHDRACRKSVVPEGGTDRAGHAPAAADEHRLRRLQPVLADQPLDGDVVGVGRGQAPVVVDDRVHRVNRPGRGLHVVDERQDVFLERH